MWVLPIRIKRLLRFTDLIPYHLADTDEKCSGAVNYFRKCYCVQPAALTLWLTKNLPIYIAPRVPLNS
ncbi:hypothetical protein AB6A40_001962 [Gnathostoma spinigerum]|uniref:Uncharacterized protein n=1 Tax=Gnathostoma spinigerum TaxID=75299 RepID=A0ABD6EEF9_9BILA